jgi:hypothetical protein
MMEGLIDEHTRESLRCVRSGDGAAEVIEALADVMVMKGVPKHIRSDNGAEFVPKDSRKSLADTGAEHALYIYRTRFSVGKRATVRASTRSYAMSS